MNLNRSKITIANGEDGHARGPGITFSANPKAPWWEYEVRFTFGSRPMRGTIQAANQAQATALLLNRHPNADRNKVAIIRRVPRPAR